jgi:hypothetical protein
MTLQKPKGLIRSSKSNNDIIITGLKINDKVDKRWTTILYLEKLILVNTDPTKYLV